MLKAVSFGFRCAAAATALVLGMAAGSAGAAPVTDLIFKLSDNGTNQINAFTGWTNTGSFNEGNVTAQMLVNNGLDYKSSLVDAWPSDLLSVRVAFYSGGVEQAFIEFDPTGTTKNNFFTQANVTSSTWSDVTGPGNFFSIPGDPTYGRHWFVNNNYGGCASDTGHMVVLDGANLPCTWEGSRTSILGSANRGFLYSTASTEVNWNSGSVGVADVFAVFATYDVPTAVPAPAGVAFLGLGVSALGLALRRRTRKISA